MKKYGATFGVIGVVFLSGACDRTPCDQQMMLKVINEDMKLDGKKPEEYKLAEIRPRSAGMYIGMSINYSPTYRFHYLIDSNTCKIIDVKYDQ